MLNHTEVGAGDPLVLVHGWAHQGATFTPLLSELPGYRLLLPDLPGHGASAPIDNNGLQGWTEALQEWLVATVDRPCHLLGWSLGGTLLLNLLQTQDLPFPVRTLTLVSATPRFIASDGWPGMPMKQMRLLKSGLRRSPEEALSAFDRLLVPNPKDTPLRTTQGGDIPSLLDGLDILQETDLRSALEQIDLPVLQIHGSKDRVVPLEAAQKISGALASQTTWLDSGHLPFYPSVKPFAQRLLEFLDES